jgi:hypothetical protein
MRTQAKLHEILPYSITALLTWLDAFDSLHACMSLRYPYTEWKAIDWQAKEAITRPLIIEAQNTNDTIAFIQALFEYLYEIPDGHINLVGNVDGFKQEKMGGTYGFNMLPIDDGFELFLSGVFNTASPSFLDPLVAYEIRESGVGYLRITAEDSD